MILYDLHNTDVCQRRLPVRPKTCFIMTHLSRPFPPQVKKVRNAVKNVLTEHRIKSIDANSQVTGKDFLTKIWEIIVSVPLGVAIISEEMNVQTLENIFYEIGLMQAYGKETIIIKTPECKVPSDFIRTEYIEYKRGFQKKFERYIDNFLELAEYYYTIAENMESNPLMAVDYLRRAYLISNKKTYIKLAKKLIDKNKKIFSLKITENLVSFCG